MYAENVHGEVHAVIGSNLRPAMYGKRSSFPDLLKTQT
ncbi:hypothetical protein I552_9222 [Mycobacterium xenopi 3993]|nr:hypothetical protein I552_9222 [Mycobacterium xenopi 3993]